MESFIQIDRNSPTPIFRQVEEQILKSIQTGELKPGDQIPSQYELARECQVSRATVQKALDRLMRDEILYYQQGKGVFVTTPTEQQSLPILQSIGHSLRSLGHYVYSDLLLTEEIESRRYISEELDLPPDANVIHIKRLLHINEEPSVIQEVYLDSGRFKSLLNYDIRTEDMTNLIQQISGSYLIGSKVAVEAKEVGWEESRLFDTPAGGSLLSVEELDFNNHEQPVRLSRNKLRGDRFRVVASTMNTCKINLEYRLRPGVVQINYR